MRSAPFTRKLNSVLQKPVQGDSLGDPAWSKPAAQEQRQLTGLGILAGWWLCVRPRQVGSAEEEEEAAAAATETRRDLQAEGSPARAPQSGA